MRRNKGWMKKIGCVLIAFAVGSASAGINTLPVLAGAGDITVDNTSFAESIAETQWYVPNGDVTVENGKILFTKDSVEDTRLITRQPATATEYAEELFTAAYTMQLNNLPQGEKFIAGFSLKTGESYAEESGNLEVAFENNGGVQVSIRVYDEGGTEKQLVSATSCGVSLGRAFSMTVKATNKMALTVIVNGRTLYSGVSPIDLEGRMGFLQTGSCEAEIHKVDIVSHTYDRPENTNITEDFESGTFNQNTMSCASTRYSGYAPQGITVEEYNGSNILMFRNLVNGALGTRHMYSNFDISFDIPYMQHRDAVDEDGDVVTPSHAGFVIGIGDDTDEHIAYGYQSSADGIVCTSSSIYSLKHDDQRFELADKGYYDAEKNEGYSVKVSVYDRQVTVYVKAIKAGSWNQVLSYTISGATPLGYVHLWTTGRANFGIDNLQITNTDKNPNLLDVETYTPPIPEAKDWEYEPMEVVYADVAQETEADFNWAFVMIYAAVAGVAIVGICLIITCAKKRPKKEVQANEN